jgi:hypothetical protein
VEAALADRPGSRQFTLSTAHNQGSSYHPKKMQVKPELFGADAPVIAVDAVTIDDIYPRYGHFDVWKLDVEFAEADALRGGTRALSETPPRAIIVEAYDEIFQEFYDIAIRTHPRAYRALITHDTYELELIEQTQWPCEFGRFHQTSPMYVFTR